MKIYALGDSALTVEFAEKISLEANARALAFSDFLEQNPFVGFVEAVPAFCSTTVFFDLLKVEKNEATAAASVEILIRKMLEKGAAETTQLLDNQQVTTLRVRYGGPDFEDVLKARNVTAEKFVELHSRPVYRTAMIGFLPGFPYFLGLDPRLEMPRKAQPARRVEAGSVAIGGAQTGIYPLASPGGWHVVGRVWEPIFDRKRACPFLLQAGDLVRFEPF